MKRPVVFGRDPTRTGSQPVQRVFRGLKCWRISVSFHKREAMVALEAGDWIKGLADQGK